MRTCTFAERGLRCSSQEHLL